MSWVVSRATQEVAPARMLFAFASQRIFDFFLVYFVLRVHQTKLRFLNGNHDEITKKHQESWCFQDHPPHDSDTDLAAKNGMLAGSFTEAEVAQALRGCKRGKAVGPDWLRNDWYCDHDAHFTPLLTTLFNLWWDEGVVARSFSKALIACLKKTKAARTAPDYRPIALLNVDYKIYTRVLANRLRGYVASMVAETQGGFVPGRSIHATIDALQTAQLQVRARDRADNDRR